jgi:hypothetical protein
MPVPSRSPSLLCPLPSPVSPRVLLPCAPTPVPCTHHLRPLRPASSTQVRRSAVRWHRRPVPCPPAPLRAPLSARLSRSASTAQPYPPPPVLLHDSGATKPPASLARRYAPRPPRHHIVSLHLRGVDMRMLRCISLPYESFCPVAALRWPPSHYTLPASRRCAGSPLLYRVYAAPRTCMFCAPRRRRPCPASSTGVPPARRRSSTPILPLPPASFRAAAACHLPRLPPTMLRAAVPPFSSFAAPSCGPRPTSSKLWRPRSSAYLPIHPSAAPSHRAPPRRYFIPRSPPAVSTFPSATSSLSLHPHALPTCLFTLRCRPCYLSPIDTAYASWIT